MKKSVELQKNHLILDNSQKTDAELVELTLENQENFEAIIKRYEQKLFSYIQRISNFNREESEDILQEVFIKVYQNINDFDQSLKFSSWIYRITHNHVISSYRKTKTRPQSCQMEEKENFLNSIASSIDTEKEIDQEILKKTVEKVLSSLEIKYQEILVLKFLEEKDYKEISDILKKPMGTVATLMNRAKKKFKEEIKKQNIKL